MTYAGRSGLHVEMPEHLVDVNGVWLCAEAFGDPEHPAVLLIHGTGSTMLSWPEELCERLASAGRFVIRYDGRDAGRSTRRRGRAGLRPA